MSENPLTQLLRELDALDERLDRLEASRDSHYKGTSASDLTTATLSHHGDYGYQTTDEWLQMNMNGGVYAVGHRVFDARRFGATGDGSTNDTTALQAAIDATEADTGVLYIPTGTYITGALTVDDEIDIVGGVGATLKGNADDIAILRVASGGAGTTIRDLRIESVESGDGDGRCVKLDDDWCTVRDCELIGANIAVQITSDWNTVRGCSIKNTVGSTHGYGQGVLIAGDHNQIVDNRIYNMAEHGVYISADGKASGGYTARYNIVANNDINTCDESGVLVYGANSDGSGQAPGEADGNVIAGNQISGTGRYGIQFAKGANRNIAQGNVLQSCGESSYYSIGVADADNAVIGNTVNGGSGDGQIYLGYVADGGDGAQTQARGCVVANNILTSSPDKGIYIDADASRLTLVGNVIRNATGRAIDKSSSASVVLLVGNITLDDNSYAVYNAGGSTLGLVANLHDGNLSMQTGDDVSHNQQF